MILILEVMPPEAAALGSASRRVFSTAGGRIGRAAGNDWVLSHRKVSSRHALVSCEDGVFYLVDEGSANGVFINSMSNRLVPGKRYALRSGDRIIIDPYEISVTVSNAQFDDVPGSRQGYAYPGHRAEGVSDPFGPFDPFGEPGHGMRTPVGRTPRPGPVPGEAVRAEEVDPLKLLGGAPPAPPRRQVPMASDLEAGSPLAGHYRPPGPTPPAPAAPAPPPPANHVIPADYDPLAPDEPDEPFPPALAPPAPPEAIEWPPDEPQDAAGRSTPAPVSRATPPPVPASSAPDATSLPAPEATPAPAPDAAREPTTPVREPPAAVPSPAAPAGVPAEAGLIEVLRGAGLENAPVTMEFARRFGQIFRVVVSGVMDVLRARQQIKDEFRMRMTQFRPADNNPLKFSANVDDALHNLLVKRNPAYLEPVEAFEDAFEDLRHHQIAMLAGMRVAFETMLAQFDPTALQEQFDRQLKRGALLGMTSRLRYWELFQERHQEMARDPEATFRRLFGEEFAKAYDEQLRRLKADDSRRRGTPRPAEG